MKKINVNKKRYKKGAAIELALFVMLIVFGLSTLLVSTSVLNRNASNLIAKKVDQTLKLDQIGQSYLSAVTNNLDLNAWKDTVINYTVTEVSSERLTLVDSQGKIRLSIKLDNLSNGYKITEWKYN